jgi:hypothetical protein
VAGGGVAVQDEAAGRPQDPVQLHQADRHLDEVREDLAFADGGTEGGYQPADGVGDLPAMQRGVREVCIGFFRLNAPALGVFEHESLGNTLEDDVVVLVRVEGGIEVDEIDAIVREVLAQNLEVVAVQQAVGVHTRPAPQSSSLKSSPRQGAP